MTCKDCIHYDVCYKKPDHFDDLTVNGGCIDFVDKSKFIELPCKVGDTVYMITMRKNIRNLTVIKIDIDGIELGKKEAEINCLATYEVDGNSCFLNIHSSKFKKTVFLTREEAEQVLKE